MTICGIALASLVCGCSDDGSESSAQDGQNNGSPSGGTSSGDDGDTCVATQLFEPQAMGELYTDGGGSDMYRDLAFDESTGELFLANGSELFRFGPDSTVPEKISDRAGQFWLRPDFFVFFPASRLAQPRRVLELVPRSGGDVEPRIYIPESDDPI